MPYAFKQISTGHVQLRYPVCPDFEKEIYGFKIPETAIFWLGTYVEYDDLDDFADSNSSGGNISDDDSRSSMSRCLFGEMMMRAMMVLVLVVAALAQHLVRFGVLVACRICIIF